MTSRRTWLSVSLLLVMACNKSSPDRPTLDKKPPPTPVEKIYTCSTNSDCVITHRKPGACCDGCKGWAVHRQQLKDAKPCNTGTAKCPKHECAKPKVIPAARCEKGRCVTRYVPRVTRTDIDTRGRYKVTAKLPPRYPCKTATDCAMTRMRPGHCCLTECPSGRVAGTRAWVAAVEALRKKRCARWLLQSSMGCTYPKCYPKGRPEVRCDKGRCTVHYKPLK